MPEGLFTPSQIQIPGIESAHLIGAMVRILPRTRLILNIADTPEQASALARNESATDGAELWYRYFTEEDRNRADDAPIAAVPSGDADEDNPSLGGVLHVHVLSLFRRRCIPTPLR